MPRLALKTTRTAVGILKHETLCTILSSHEADDEQDMCGLPPRFDSLQRIIVCHKKKPTHIIIPFGGFLPTNRDKSEFRYGRGGE